eukprot:jgi/Picsp_1/768/NSC_04257-R1_protein integral to the mitochondrial membrane
MQTKILKGALVYFAGTSAAYIYLRKQQDTSHALSEIVWDDAKSCTTFNRVASKYDRDIGWDETFMGLLLLRRFLVGKAEGHVLEVSAGTGRNLKYYDPSKVKSLTVTDRAREMLLEAKDKLGTVSIDGVRLALADVQSLSGDTGRKENSKIGEETAEKKKEEEEEEEETPFGPALRHFATFQQECFDSVVDTFGLCSCSDPVKALSEIVRVTKPGGKILLLEHGIGSWEFINVMLNKQASDHCTKWGCEWNRDVLKLVQSVPGIEVESIKRWHFGTTYVIHARKKM